MEPPFGALRHPLVIAHRGSMVLGPENTLYSFELADAAGADVLELDVHPSSDGHIMVIHDPTVDRTSNGTGAVRSLRLNELKALDFAWQFRLPDTEGYPMRGMGIGIPTLNELFDRFPGRSYSIDIKENDPDFATEVVRLIHRREMRGRVVFGSFHPRITRILRAAVPPISVAADRPAALRLLATSYAGLPARWLSACDAYMLPDRAGLLPVATTPLVRAIHRLGRRLYVWTIDDPAVMRRLLALGADGIITNRTDLAFAARSAFLEAGGRLDG